MPIIHHYMLELADSENVWITLNRKHLYFLLKFVKSFALLLTLNKGCCKNY